MKTTYIIADLKDVIRAYLRAFPFELGAVSYRLNGCAPLKASEINASCTLCLTRGAAQR